jgi:hypothetical protein
MSVGDCEVVKEVIYAISALTMRFLQRRRDYDPAVYIPVVVNGEILIPFFFAYVVMGAPMQVN